MAAQVMAMPQSGSIQREMEPKKEKEKIQLLPMAAPQSDRPIQREMEPKKEKEKIQMMPSLQRASDGNQEAGGNLENRLNSSKGGGSPLPDDVRSFMEPRFGADFSQVRVHTGSESVQMNRDLNAQAFTHRQDVYFGAGKAPGKDMLTAHELTHVVQQTGKVQAKNSNPVLTQRKPQSSQSGNNFSDTTHLRNSSINSFSVGSSSIQRDPDGNKDEKPAIDKWLSRLGPFGISEGDDGLIYFYLKSFTLVKGRTKSEPVEIAKLEGNSPDIPLPIEGLTATAGFKFIISANVAYTLEDLVLTDVRLGIAKGVASTVLGIPDLSSPTSILLNLTPSVWLARIPMLISSLQLAILTGKPPFWLTYAKGTAGIKTGGSAEASIGFTASGEASVSLLSKKLLKLAALEVGVNGAIGAKLSAESKVDVLGMIVDSGHMTFKHRRELNLSAGVFASLSAFLKASALGGLFSKRFTVNWTREKDLINIRLANTPKGAIDVDFDNGIKDEKKLIELDAEDIKKAFAIYEAIKSLFTTTEAEGKVKGDEQDELEEKKEKENSLPDNRDLSQVKKDLRLAIIDSEALLTMPNATPEDVLAQLPTIKRTYRLTAIRLLHPSIDNDLYLVEVEINPTLKTDPPRNLKSGKSQKDLSKAKAEFRNRLFPRLELQELLGIGETKSKNLISEWMQISVLYVLRSKPKDPLTQYSFSEKKAGQRELEDTESNRERYGYRNPGKKGPVGRKILSKGLRSDSPQPVLVDDINYHQMRARYDTKNPKHKKTDFGFKEAVLGHKDPGASGDWNDQGHKRSKKENEKWNQEPDNYWGPEHEAESSQSGGGSPRYRIPSKADDSHEDWLYIDD